MHFFHKWGPIDLNGYQTCEICGLTRSAGVPQCAHGWQEMPDGRLKCMHCGDFKIPECRHELERKEGHFVCMKCGFTKYDPSQKCEHHDWQLYESTCKGSKTYVIQQCKYCGILQELEMKAAYRL